MSQDKQTKLDTQLNKLAFDLVTFSVIGKELSDGRLWCWNWS